MSFASSRIPLIANAAFTMLLCPFGGDSEE